VKPTYPNSLVPSMRERPTLGLRELGRFSSHWRIVNSKKIRKTRKTAARPSAASGREQTPRRSVWVWPGKSAIASRKPRRWSSHQVNSLRILSALLVGEVESRNVEGSGVPESLVLSGNATSES
jgi:hypothetical protein